MKAFMRKNTAAHIVGRPSIAVALQELEDKRDIKNAVIKAMQDAIAKRKADCQVLQDKLAKLNHLEQVLPFASGLGLLACRA